MTVSIWQHVIVVIGLLTSNAVTFFVCKRRVEELKAALLAKRVLLGGYEVQHVGTYGIVPGDTLDMSALGAKIGVRASTPVTLEVFRI